MKLINGWYNIHDFNDRCCGQLKVAIIPSQPVSPSKSSKYFKKHEIVEPCNLHLAFYNSKPVSSSVVSNLENGPAESSFLFEQLRQNLKDLEKMTHDIKTRSDKSSSEKEPVTLLQHERLQHFDDSSKQTTSDKKPEDYESYSPDMAQDTNTSGDPSNISEGSLHDSSGTPILDDVEHVDTEFEYPERDDSARLCTNASGDEPSVRNSSDSSQDENIVRDDGSSREGDQELNDSTDDLLEHLREFERKYKHLKTIVQNDSDFEYDDDLEVTSSPAFTSPRDALRSQKSTFFTEGGIEDSFFDQVVNVSSGEPSKEEIKVLEPNAYRGDNEGKVHSNGNRTRDPKISSNTR